MKISAVTQYWDMQMQHTDGKENMLFSHGA